MKLYTAAAMEETLESVRGCIFVRASTVVSQVIHSRSSPRSCASSQRAELTAEEKELETRIKVARAIIDAALGPLPPSTEELQAMKMAADIECLTQEAVSAANNEAASADSKKDEL